MKTSSIFVPVLFIVLLFVIVLPRLARSQSANAQVLPSTSITPAFMPEPKVSVRPLSGSQPPAEVLSAQTYQGAVLAQNNGSLAGLSDFAAPYLNGRADEAVAVAVEGRFTLPVVQQPQGEPAFVSPDLGVLTQFALPRQYGTTGFLAHNFLSGRLFSAIMEGDLVTVIRGDGSADQFQVVRIESFQALSPNSPYSQFIDLTGSASGQLTSANLFTRIYTQPDQLVFQTCIAANGDPSWGRLFITATRTGLNSLDLSISDN